MKKHRFKYLCLGLLSAFVLDAGTPAFAFNLQASFSKNAGLLSYEEPIGNHRPMGNEKPIGNDELDNMRGGFVTSNGMVIDFSFSANTLIDGQLVKQITIDTSGLPTSEGLLRNIIQVGHGNQAFDDTPDVDALPNVLTVVQNNLDNLTIQQVNLLDLTVNNVSNFVNRSIGLEMDFQSAMGLAP